MSQTINCTKCRIPIGVLPITEPPVCPQCGLSPVPTRSIITPPIVSLAPNSGSPCVASFQGGRNAPQESEIRQRPQLSSLAVKSLLFGLPGVLCFPLGIVGLVLGWQAYCRIKDKRNNEYGDGFAIAGMVLGGSSLLLVAIVGLDARRNEIDRSGPNRQRDNWRQIDASDEARKVTWQLILKHEQRRIAVDEAEHLGIAPPRMVQTNKSNFDVEHLGKQHYRVTGEYSEQLSIGMQGALGDPRYRSKADRKTFEAFVCQTAKGKWEFESFTSDWKPRTGKK